MHIFAICSSTAFIESFIFSSLMIKFAMLVLLVMSILSWTLIFFKSYQLKDAKKSIIRDIKIFRTETELKAAIKHLKKTPDSPSFKVASESIKEVIRLKDMKLPDEKRDRIILDSVRDYLQEEVNDQSEALYGALYFLGTCTTVAPLLGLFGTVWGIMNSFHGFRGLTTSNLSAIAPGLAEALITTVLGLMVAIPAALAHNVLIKSVESIQIRLAKFSSALLRLLQKDLT